MTAGDKTDAAAVLRQLQNSESREELLRRMTPENRALYERIRERRERIGRIEGFDIVAELRRLRDNG